VRARVVNNSGLPGFESRRATPAERATSLSSPVVLNKFNIFVASNPNARPPNARVSPSQPTSTRAR
jgi:hypothetical protein